MAMLSKPMAVLSMPNCDLNPLNTTCKQAHVWAWPAADKLVVRAQSVEIDNFSKAVFFARPAIYFVKAGQAQWQAYQKRWPAKPNGQLISQWPFSLLFGKPNDRFIKKVQECADLQIYATGCKFQMIPCEQVISGRASQFSLVG